MGDDSDAQLEQRVDQLEQQLSKMLPGRRGVLKGIGAAALGGAAVGGATGGAAGQSAAGQIGTESSPVDVEGASVNAGVSFTDPAGVQHTGELADIDDVGGGSGLTGIADASSYTGVTGGEQIQAALDDGDAGGHHTVYVPPDGPDDVSGSSGSSETEAWEITNSLQIPSNTTLILNGSTLFLSDSTDDNLIRNASADSGDATRNENIHILGWAQPVLDGNQNNQTNLTSNGTRYLNHGVHFYKVDNYSIRGIEVGKCNAFAILREDVTNGVCHNIYFNQDDQTPNSDGDHVMGPGNNNHGSLYRGSAADDMLAADADGSNNGNGYGRGSGGALTNTSWSNVVFEDLKKSGALRTLASSGNPLDGVFVHNVQRRETSSSLGQSVLKLGWTNASTQPAESEHQNIVVDGVYASTTDKAGSAETGAYVRIDSPIRNVTVRSPRGVVGPSGAFSVDTGASFSEVNLVDWSHLDDVTLPNDVKWDGQYIQSATPADPSENDVWMDTS